MKRDCISSSLSRAFYHYGTIVATCPLPFLLAPIFGSLALSAGFLLINPTSDLEYLYVPIDAPGKVERRDVEETFLYSERDYFTSMRRTRIGGLLRILVQDKDGGNLFTDEHIAELFQLDAYVKAVTVEDDDGNDMRFNDICSRWKGRCADIENTFLYYMVNRSVESTTITYPVYMTQAGPLIITQQIGGPRFDSNGFIKEFKALALSYSLRYDTVTYEDKAKAWSRKLVKQILNEYDSQMLDVNIETFETIERELDAAIYEVVPLFTITFMILGTFAGLSVLMKDWVRGKNWIASAGMIAAMLGAASGMGFLLFCGVSFNTAVGAVPFLIIGIGMDDMYILVAAWRCTDYTLPTEERIGQTLKHSAVSITITSITDGLAFGIGCITPFRSVQMFCAYTMVGVVFCYFYQLTFTLACMVYDGRREERNRHCLTFRKIKPRSEASDRSKAYQLFCTGGDPTPVNTNHIQDNEDVEEDEKHASPRNEEVAPKLKLPFINDFMGTKFAVFLMKTPVKIVIVVIYLFYLGFAIWGITMMKEGLDRANLVPDTSYFVRYFEDYNKYFGNDYGPTVMFMYNEPLNYTQATVREEIEYNLESFKRNPLFYGDQYAVTSWLDAYKQYLDMTSRDLNTLSEMEFIYILRNEFLTIPGYSFFLSDISFDPSNTSIRASRMFIQSKGTQDSVEERAIMETSRDIAKESKFDAYTFHVAFTYFDQYTIVLQNTLQNLAIATASMLVVALIFIPSITTVLWVTITTISIEIGVMGYMVFWGVNLDAISMINLIMCIGFSVDFAAHISYHYTISESLDPTECAKEALGQLGAPIVQAALSTILGVAILSISASYIFRTFFKIVSLVMIFGSFHALFLLPVILSSIQEWRNMSGRARDDVRGLRQNGSAVRYPHLIQANGAEPVDYKVEIFLK